MPKSLLLKIAAECETGETAKRQLLAMQSMTKGELVERMSEAFAAGRDGYAGWQPPAWRPAEPAKEKKPRKRSTARRAKADPAPA